MTEKFEPGDQVEILGGSFADSTGTVVEGNPSGATVRVAAHLGDREMEDSLPYFTSELRLIARYADLVAEDQAQVSDPFNWLTTDTIDATQEAIERVRASEKRAAPVLGSVEPEPPVHAQILTEAETLLVGDRQRDYGPPEVNFRRIADVWDVLVPKTGGWQSDEVALAMAGLKLARAAEGFKRDTAVDAAAYVALWAHLQKEPS